MIALRLTILSLLVCGLLYPLAIAGIAKLSFPRQAGGSLIAGADGRPVGSELVGQRFDGPAWFHGRPSAVAYKAEAAAASNLGPTSRKLRDRIAGEAARVRAENPAWGQRPLPADLVMGSGSGIDPHISPAAARLQASRVARARNLRLDELNRLIDAHTEDPDWGMFGAARVNVLQLNLALIQ